MNKFIKASVVAAAATLSVAASATGVTAQFNSVSWNDGDSGLAIVNGSAPHQTLGTEFIVQLTTGKSFAAYCMEPLDSFGGNGAQYDLNQTTIASVGKLFAAAGFNGSGYKNDAINTGVEGSALQLAIWEVLYDGLKTGPENLYTASLDLSTSFVLNDGTSNWLSLTSGGNFKGSGFGYDAISLATQYLNTAASLTGSYGANVIQLTAVDGSKQNLVTSVPEPSTYALMAACLGVIGFVTRRKISK